MTINYDLPRIALQTKIRLVPVLQVFPDVDLHLLRRDAHQRTNRADRLAVPDLGLGERITDDW